MSVFFSAWKVDLSFQTVQDSECLLIISHKHTPICSESLDNFLLLWGVVLINATSFPDTKVLTCYASDLVAA